MKLTHANKTARFVPIAGQMTLLALLVTALGACDPEAPAGEEIEAAPGELNLNTVIFDGPGRATNTTCNGVHCCPPGYVMIGAHLSNNTFACAFGFDKTLPPRGISGDVPVQFDHEYIDVQGGIFTTRSGMHSCLPGYVMVGYSQAQNKLVCKRPVNPSLTMVSEYVDYGSLINAGYGMHACNQNGIANPYRYAMTGIHAGLNRFACTY